MLGSRQRRSEVTVGGEQQQPRGLAIQPPDGKRPRRHLGNPPTQISLTPGIPKGARDAFRLVEHGEVLAVPSREDGAIQRDAIFRIHERVGLERTRTPLETDTPRGQRFPGLGNRERRALAHVLVEPFRNGPSHDPEHSVCRGKTRYRAFAMAPPEDAFRLDIEILAPPRVDPLARIFRALQRIKSIQFGPEQTAPEGWLEEDDPRWTELLDDEARAHFEGAFDYASEEGRTWQSLWDLTDPSRRDDPIFEVPGPWPYDSVIAALYSAEYVLLGLGRRSQRDLVLRYDPLAGPFGGTEGLIQLVESFGQRVVHDGWTGGPPPRTPPGWDYARARALVDSGRGIE